MGERPLEARHSSTPPAAVFDGNERFVVLRPLGKGGMGTVYAVHDRETDTDVALKLLTFAKPELLLRFKEEFRALRDLVHPNLVRLFELHEDRGLFFFTMELLSGQDFLSWVRAEAGGSTSTISSAGGTPGGDTSTRVERSPTGAEAKRETVQGPSAAPTVPVRPLYDESRLRNALAQLATALAALHRSGRVHRDVKPSNLLVEPEGRLVLLDFGVVGLLEPEDEVAERFIVGTASHMAPEQARGQPPAPAADWYAVGVLLFEALAGRLPFEGRDRAELLGRKLLNDPPSLRLLHPGAPADLADLTMRLLARDPAQRPSEAEILSVLGAESPDAWLRVGALAEGASSLFVGREEELAGMESAFAESRTGKAVTLVVSGPSGVGKSSLVRAFATRLANRGERALVLRGRCHEKESVRFKAFDGIVDGLARHLAGRAGTSLGDLEPASLEALARVFPVLRSVPFVRDALLGLHFVDEDLGDVRALAFDALRRLFERLAKRRALVLLVDDVQWADADSLALLAELFRPPDPPPLLLLFTERRGPDSEPCAASASALPAKRELVLGGLAPDDARRLVKRVLEAEHAECGLDLEKVVREADGHPMFLDELVRHLAHRQPGEVAFVGLDDALLARAQGLDSDARGLLDVVATAASPLPHPVVAEAAGLAPSDYADRTAVLRASRLVRISGIRREDTVEPYHDRVREAVYDHLTGARRLALHDRLASVLITHGGDAALVAAHLSRGSRPEESVPHFLRAAREARAALAFERAAKLLRSALAHGRFVDAERRGILVDLAENAKDAGHASTAADAFVEAALVPGTEPLVARDLLRRASEHFLASGHLEKGIEVARRLLGELGYALPGSRVGAITALLFTDARIGLSRIRWAPRPEEALGPDALSESDVLWSVSAGLSLVDSIDATLFGNKGLLHALSLGEPSRVARFLCAGAISATAIGRFGRSDAMRSACGLAADQAGDERARLYLELAEMAHSFLGTNEWTRTHEHAANARRLWKSIGGTHGWETNLMAQFECWAHHQKGDLPALRAHVPEHIRSAQRMGNRFIEVNFRTFFVDMALADDRPAEALADVEDAIASWRPISPEFNNQDYLALGSRTRIALYTGAVDDAALDAEWERFFGSLLRQVLLLQQDGFMLRGGLALLRARRALARGDASTAKRHLAYVRKAVKALSKMPLPLARIETHPLLAGVHAIEGNEAAAVEELRKGHAAFAERSMGLWEACLGQVLGERLMGDEGSELRARSDSYFESHGIRDRARTLRGVLPGLGPEA